MKWSIFHWSISSLFTFVCVGGSQTAGAYSSTGQIYVLHAISLAELVQCLRLRFRNQSLPWALHTIVSSWIFHRRSVESYTKVFKVGHAWERMVVYSVWNSKQMLFLCKSQNNTFSPIKWHFPGRAPVRKILRAFVEIRLVLYFSYFVVQNTVLCKHSCHRLTWLPKSFIKIRNKRGPTTGPWGTPETTSMLSELTPPTNTLWPQFTRYDSIHSGVLLLFRIIPIFLRSPGCVTRSKALEKSINTTLACPCLSRDSTMSYTLSVSWVAVESRRLKPCWRASRKVATCLSMMCSTI